MTQSASNLLYYKAVSEILDLVTRFQNGDFSEREFSPKEREALRLTIEKINLLDQHFEEQAQAHAQTQILTEAKTLNQSDSISRCLDYITLLASLNFNKKLDVRTEENTEVAALATGLNMLSEELQYSTVSRAQLIEERDLADGVIETAPVIVLVLDKDGKILRLNSYLEQLCGYKQEDVFHKDWINIFIPPCEREHAKKGFQLVINEEHSSVAFKNIQSKCGKEIPIEWYSKTMKNRRGEVVGLLCIGIDTSEHARYEHEKNNLQSQLFHAEKLASIGTLAAGIAHEINNPLAIVKGYVEELIKQVEQVDPHKIDEKILGSINEGIARITLIVGGLRTYARASTDHVEALDINKVIRDVIPFIQQITHSTSVTIKQKLAADPLLIRCNYGKIQQVLINLLTNACDALQERPSNRQIVIETLSDGGTVTIRFTDNGSGMPAAVLTKIFDPFFTTKPLGKGTGLGLSISYTIIQSFGGSITATSEEGEGSTFEIALPHLYLQTTPVKHIENDTKPISASNLKGEILVIDDEPGLCALFEDYLAEAGLTVTTMVNASAALKLMREKRFDVIITDMQMPGCTGIELIKQAQDFECQARARFIIITGDILTSYNLADRDFLREIVQGYLMKPFDQEQLITLVRSLLPSSS